MTAVIASSEGTKQSHPPAHLGIVATFQTGPDEIAASLEDSLLARTAYAVDLGYLQLACFAFSGAALLGLGKEVA